PPPPHGAALFHFLLLSPGTQLATPSSSFFHATATAAIYTLSLHDALPIFLTSKRSISPHGLTSQHLERSPTIVRRTIHGFGDTFSPDIFSAQSHSTSELLRTL